MRRAALLLAITALLAAPIAAFAAEPFSANLTPGAEVPPATVPDGYEGAGTASAVISDDETEIQVEVNFDGLTGPAAAGHIHYGETGVAGPVIFPLDLTAGSPVNQTLTEADFTAPDPGAGPQTYAEALAAIREGETYVNVHTEANPPGELRGQLEVLPDTATGEPAAPAAPASNLSLWLLLAVGLASFVLAARWFAFRRA
ncbi:hypothetical protein BH24CHL5_BH24CHL5_05450 [soil metagenome]